MQLAAKYGVTAKAVRDIWNLRTWAVRVMMCSLITPASLFYSTVLRATRVLFLQFRLVLLACILTRRPPHTVGDAPSLVAGGPREIPFQAPVRILQAPRREVASDGM